jgi:uncharacterized protein (TIGR03437 family)
LTATVTAASGSAVPTGSVTFVAYNNPLGSVTLTSSGSAALTLPLYILGVGSSEVAAQYSGDAAFSGGGATTIIKVTVPSTGAGIEFTGPNNVWPDYPDAQGPVWSTQLSVAEVAGVAALITGFTIDGVAQPLAQYFPSTALPAHGTLTALVLLRNVPAPTTHTYGLTGVDLAGLSWSRQLTIGYYPEPVTENFNLMGTPLVIAQNPNAGPSCQWSTQLNVDDQGGNENVMEYLFVGGGNNPNTVPIAPIFGTTRVGAWGGVQGVLCFSGITPGGISLIEVLYANGLEQQVTVAFNGPLANPTQITATPASVSMTTTGSGQTAVGNLSINPGGTSQSWTAAIYPANRTTGWLTLSQTSGTGPVQIALTANGSGFEPGAYRATIVIQSPNTMPQYVNVPVLFVLTGGASGPNIGAVVNAATSQPGSSPGELVTVYGTNLASTTAGSSGSPLPYTLGGVTATVNGLPAPLLYVSPTQINLQVPYEVGANLGTIGITNNGVAGGEQIQILPASPGIFLDNSGILLGNPFPSVKPGGVATLFVTGIGEVSQTLSTAFSPGQGTPLIDLPAPLLPLSVTVGGVQAFVTFIGITPGLIGTAQLNFGVPPGVPAGVQPVVVTVAGVSSPAGNITVLAP